MYNMYDILHIVGLCPDSASHYDLIDFTVANYQNIVDIVAKYIKYGN